MSRTSPGHVDFVGAGPGDPGLLTLRGAEYLAQADVVIYDALVNPRLLAHCRPEAELISLGRHGATRIVPQDEVHELMIARARLGRHIVRLKGGDPAVFARIAEETEALAAASIDYRIVPGVTVALAAGSYAGIPLTNRHCASAVALVTAHQSEVAPHDLDFPALARFPGTLVFYMGMTSAPAWVAALIAGGRPAETPAALVRYCSWPRQQSWRTTLGDIPDLILRERIRPPTVAIVGEAVASAGPSWFTARPLFGTRALVTRPRAQAHSLAHLLAEQGADVLLQPAIEIAPPDDWDSVDRALDRLAEFDWLVFASANGVRSLLGRLLARGGDLRSLAGLRLAAIGSGTADELSAFHLRADLVPERFVSESLVAALLKASPRGRFLLARANRGREALDQGLAAGGAQVEQVAVYQSRDVTSPDPQIAAQLAAGAIDWITVTSPAIARALIALFGPALARARLASLSPITSTALRRADVEPAVEATEATMAALCDAIVAARQN